MELIRACQEDIKEIALMEEKIFSNPWSEKILKDYILSSNSIIYILRDKDPIGYLCGSEILGEVSLDRIGIDKEKRGKGYSKILMDRFIEDKKEKDFTLEVRSDNEAALCLYKNYGFKEEGLRKDYYGLEKDAIIMWRRK